VSFEWLASELVGLEYQFHGGVPDATVQAASIAIALPFPPSYVDFLRPSALASSYEDWLRGLILQIRSVEAGDEPIDVNEPSPG